MYCRRLTKIFRPSIFFLLPPAQTRAQSPEVDSASWTKTINNALAVYYQSAGDQSRLYNGTEYTGYPYSFVEGTPFFLSSQEQKGSIVYDNMEYREVDLQYDEMSDVVIFQDENHRIELSNERISAFSIGNDRFIRIIRDSLSQTKPETGFYLILHEGNLSVFKKEIKAIRQIYSSQDITRVIDTKTNYYLKKNNQWVPVNSQKELLNYFSDRKKEIQRYIKTNKLNFKKDPDNLLVKVAVYNDQQTK